jgi:hypothetical protein
MQAKQVVSLDAVKVANESWRLAPGGCRRVGSQLLRATYFWEPLALGPVASLRPFPCTDRMFGADRSPDS